MAREQNNKIGFYINGQEKELIDCKFKLSNLSRDKFYQKMIIYGGKCVVYNWFSYKLN
jgi:hypothetical protein